jgi:hypothetical protein
MRKLAWSLLGLLVILHHDFWFWHDPTLVAGWFPIGLLYHVGLSIVAAGFWLFVVKCVWPSALADEQSSTGSTGESAEVPQA